MFPTPYTLYYSPVSICSYMLRYALAIRGPPAEGKDDITIEEKEVDIQFTMEQMTEDFILNVNPRGEVPTITSPVLPKPLPDSLAMTDYFSLFFPQLKPASHAAQIDDVLAKIHAPLPYLILSFGGGHPAAHIPKLFIRTMEDLLKREDVQGEYRKALQKKVNEHKAPDLDVLFGNESVREAEKTMRTFLEDVDGKLPSGESWLFGLSRPSAADAHLVAVLVRLQDVGREHLFPAKVKEYVERVKRTTEWQGVMNGLTTTMALE